MSTITAADKRVRPAGVALEAGLTPQSGVYAVDEGLEHLAAEQIRLHEAVASLLTRMNEPGLASRDLDRLTRSTTHMLALAEDLRRLRARTVARRAGAGRTWRARLAVD